MFSQTYTTQALTPFRALVRDILVGIMTISAWFFILYYTWHNGFHIRLWIDDWADIWLDKYHIWCAAILLPPFLWFPQQWIFSRLMAARKKVTITADQIKFRQYLSTKEYSRHQPHRFLLRENPWGPFEAAFHALLKGRTRQHWWIKKYWQRSYLLCLQAGHKRHVVASIYGRQMAPKNLSGLNAKLALVDGQTGTGQGISEDPKDLWSNESGGL